MSNSELADITRKLVRAEKVTKDVSSNLLASQKELSSLRAEFSRYKAETSERYFNSESSQIFDDVDLLKVIRRLEHRINEILESSKYLYSDAISHVGNGDYDISRSRSYDDIANMKHLSRVLESILNELYSMQNSRVLKMTKIIGSKLPPTTDRIFAQTDYLKTQLDYILSNCG